MDPDQRIATLATRQRGVFTRTQALEAGATRAMITHRLDAGRWERLHAGVYRLAGTPRTWDQDLLAAWMAVGADAVVSHRAAAARPDAPQRVDRRRVADFPVTWGHLVLRPERLPALVQEARSIEVWRKRPVQPALSSTLPSGR